MSLANKVRPKTFEDVIGQDAIVNKLKWQIENNNLSNAYLFIGPSGVGKAQPLYSQVLTKTGFVNMGDVYVGQEVFDASGETCFIDGIYPQGVRDIYEITLQDRTKIRVSDEHLNCIEYWYGKPKRYIQRTLTTLELLELFKTRGKTKKLRMPVPEVDWEEVAVPIDPYLLGILIAEGSLHNNFRVSLPEPDVYNKVSSILAKVGHELRQYEKTKTDYRICCPGHINKGKKEQYAPLKQLLFNMGLLTKSVDKHIPKEYLLTSRRNRLLLLQGLFDGDGTICSGTATYSTSSKRLSEDFAFLVRSLGIRDTVTTKQPFYTNGGTRTYCNTSYIHHLKVENGVPFFSSEKHKKRYVDRQHSPLRNIVSIEYVGKEACQCIHVTSPKHTYISDGFIPTHNTTMARVLASVINEGKGIPIEIDGAVFNGTEDVKAVIEQASTRALDAKYKVVIYDEVLAITTQAWQAFLKCLEEPPMYTIFILCTTEDRKIPDTVISRLDVCRFRRPTDKQVEELLNKIDPDCQYNSIIAEKANNNFRTAVKYYEQTQHCKTIDELFNELNMATYDDVNEFVYHMVDYEQTEANEQLESLYYNGTDLIEFLKQIRECCCEQLLYPTMGNISWNEWIELLKWTADTLILCKFEHNVKTIIETAIWLRRSK